MDPVPQTLRYCRKCKPEIVMCPDGFTSCLAHASDKKLEKEIRVRESVPMEEKPTSSLMMDLAINIEMNKRRMNLIEKSVQELWVLANTRLVRRK